MGRMYVASGVTAAVTTADDIFQLTTDDDSVIMVHRISLRVSTTTDEACGVQLERLVTAMTGGTGVDEVPLDPGDAAGSATVLNQPTTGGVTPVEIGRWNMSTLAGLEVIYTPEERPILSGAQPALLLSTEDTITSATIDWMVTFEEIG